MDSSSAQLHHHQDMSSQTLESMLVCTKTSAQQENKKPRPAEQALKCPRCDSTNTKFCYYNNYSLTQPRYFCKSCRRYWTKGGTLRNVPVGGGCRKNKRSSSSSSSSSLSKRGHDHHQAIGGTTSTNCTNPLLLSSVFTSSTTTTTQPPLSYDHSDHLSLAIARLQKQTSGGGLHHHHQGFDQMLGSGSGGTTTSPSTTNNPSSTSTSCFDILGGFLESCTNASTSTGLQSLYYGLNNINCGGSLGLGIHNHPGVLSYEDHHLEQQQEEVSTGLKQEMLCNVGSTRDIGDQISSSNNNNRVLWGFPWQFNGGHDQGNLGDFHDSGRQNWNGFGSTSSSSSWHGLLNSPLM